MAKERGRATTLQAQLQQYALGGDQPLSVGAIIVRVVLVVAGIVLLVFIVARMLMFLG
ncbi:MAG: hypothetical protein K8S97_12145 [Anaerolineae bacterium]|nr:hypothetical protein [Anaerolineae bacterium]